MPTLVTVTIQSALLKAAANITAQSLAAWKSQTNTPFDWARVLEFAFFGVISAPLISLWQQKLEEKFPTQHKVNHQTSHPRVSKQPPHAKPFKRTTNSPPEVNWGNVFVKLFLDKTIGLFVTNVIFLTCMTAARLLSVTLIIREIEARIVGILKVGWKIWAPVALINFIWVPWQWRVTVASIVGFGWNIVLSLLAS